MKLFFFLLIYLKLSITLGLQAKKISTNFDYEWQPDVSRDES